MKNYPKFVLAAIQAAPHFFDREASAEKACRLIQEAAKKGATLAAFGETWLSGWPWWAGMGGPKQGTIGGDPSSAIISARVAYLENAVEIPSLTTDRLCQAAGDAGIDVAIGIAERDRVTHGTTYCTLLFIGREGKILGRHRKLKPTGHERTVWGEGDGSSLRVYKREYAAIGGLNCWEHMMMLPGYALIAQGIQVHVASWPFHKGIGSEGGKHGILSRALALQGQCYVVAVGATYRRENIPDSLAELHSPEQESDEGGSCIIDPLGNVIAQAPGGEEAIITVEGSLEVITQRKLWCDTGGHYSRPDVFQLIINRRPLEEVMELDSIDRSRIPTKVNDVSSHLQSADGNKQESEK